MSDTELVIKISEEKLSIIKNKMYCGIYDAELYKAIANGTPLPKGHGRLIDADAFIKQESCCGYIEDMEIDYFKQNTPTIIEADTKSEG